MMSVVLLAVGATLALPSYRHMAEKREDANGAEQLASFINTAREVAVKTNQVVTFSYAHSDHDEWCVGAASGETACDCTETDSLASDYCSIATQPFILNSTHAGDLDLLRELEGQAAHSFDPATRLVLQKGEPES